jgi:hypothetical protein
VIEVAEELVAVAEVVLAELAADVALRFEQKEIEMSTRETAAPSMEIGPAEEMPPRVGYSDHWKSIL